MISDNKFVVIANKRPSIASDFGITLVIRWWLLNRKFVGMANS